MSQQQQPPQNPAPTTAVTPKVKLAATPDDFDGGAVKYKSWLRQIKLYILANRITDNEQKVLFTLSYMKTGIAATFADKQIDDIVGGAPAPVWADFVKQLEGTFLDKTITLKARERLEEFRQGTLVVDEFLLQLDKLFVEANLNDDSERMRLIEKSTSRHIIDAIYQSGNVPGDPKAYAERIILIGRLWETRKAQQSLRQPHPAPSRPQHHAPAKAAATFTTRPPLPAGDKQTPTGIVHGGRGAPMDIDKIKQNNRCYGCGKLGHFRRDCDEPVKPFVNVRQMALNLTDEERSELLAAFASPSVSADPVASQEDDSKFFQDFLDGR